MEFATNAGKEKYKGNNVYCYRSISNLPAKKAQVLLIAEAIYCGTCSVLSVSIWYHTEMLGKQSLEERQ